MSKNQRTKFHVRKRMFLNRDTDMRAFAIGIVEDTRDIPTEDENGWNSAWIELVLADCYRHVSFDFNLNTTPTVFSKSVVSPPSSTPFETRLKRKPSQLTSAKSSNRKPRRKQKARQVNSRIGRLAETD